MKPLIQVDDLWFRYPQDGGDDLFKGVNMRVFPGQVVAITGSSGCGKTTLAYCISGIIPKIYPGEISGNIELCGQSIKNMKLPEIAQKMGFVFQNPDTQLFSPLIEDDVAFGPENLCMPWDEMDQRIENALDLVNMSMFRFTSPDCLSGGQRQLAALAAVLSLNPDILVFDEAMSQLDAQGCKMVEQIIMRLKQQGKGILLIEHDKEKLSAADQILTFAGGRLEVS